MATKLEDLKLDEVSGVDEPANLVPGWLLMKAKDPVRLGPVRLTDGRQIGKVIGYLNKTDGTTTLTVDWVSDELRDLAKQGHLEEREDGVYLVGDDAPLNLGKAALKHGAVHLT